MAGYWSQSLELVSNLMLGWTKPFWEQARAHGIRILAVMLPGCTLWSPWTLIVNKPVDASHTDVHPKGVSARRHADRMPEGKEGSGGGSQEHIQRSTIPPQPDCPLQLGWFRRPCRTSPAGLRPVPLSSSPHDPDRCTSEPCMHCLCILDRWLLSQT